MPARHDYPGRRLVHRSRILMLSGNILTAGMALLQRHRFRNPDSCTSININSHHTIDGSLDIPPALEA